MKVRLQSGYLTGENQAAAPQDYLEKEALLVYQGKFESAEGPVTVSDADLERTYRLHNARMAKKIAQCGGEIRPDICVPIQLDHSPSAQVTVGRLWGPVRLGTIMIDVSEDDAPPELEERKALFGNIRLFGSENIERASDGRWVHGSIGADFDEGRINEWTITPFPAAENARMLSKVKLPTGDNFAKYNVLNSQNDIETTVEADSLESAAAKVRAILKKDGSYDFREIQDPKTRKTILINRFSLSKGEPMDKEKLRAHLMEKEKLSAEDADKKLAGMSDDECKKLSAEIDEKEKLESDDKSKEKLTAESEEKKDGDKKDDEEKDKKLSEKTPPAGKDMDEREDKEPEHKKEVEKLSAAKASFVQLAKGFKKSQTSARLAARVSSISTRLSKLRAEAKITPAEIKAFKLEDLAKKSDEALDTFFEAFAHRQPVILVGQVGSSSAERVSKIASEVSLSQLEEETAKNMPFSGKAALARKKAGGEKSTKSTELAAQVDGDELESAYGKVCRMMEEGKKDEALAALRSFMSGGKLTGEMEEGTEARLSALAESNKSLHNQFEELVKLVSPILGVESEDLN